MMDELRKLWEVLGTIDIRTWARYIAGPLCEPQMQRQECGALLNRRRIVTASLRHWFLQRRSFFDSKQCDPSK
eukprot:jgi/Tetstr1/448521/TSEL_035786.t1